MVAGDLLQACVMGTSPLSIQSHESTSTCCRKNPIWSLIGLSFYLPFWSQGHVALTLTEFALSNFTTNQFEFMGQVTGTKFKTLQLKFLPKMDSSHEETCL